MKKGIKKPKPAAAKPRQTQAQRRDAMRTRILDATLFCLAKYGYAGTGVNQVVTKARVSRGAWSHHFPSMQALILEAAQYLVTRVYERLAVVIKELSQSKDGMRSIIYTAWNEFYASEVNEIYLELLIASRRDAKLAAMLGGLSNTLQTKLGSASDFFFVTQPNAVNTTTELMILNRWLLRGIALDAPLVGEAGVEKALDAWSRLMATQIRNR